MLIVLQQSQQDIVNGDPESKTIYMFRDQILKIRNVT
jgi:hypothetical protein